VYQTSARSPAPSLRLTCSLQHFRLPHSSPTSFNSSQTSHESRSVRSSSKSSMSTYITFTTQHPTTNAILPTVNADAPCQNHLVPDNTTAIVPRLTTFHLLPYITRAATPSTSSESSALPCQIHFLSHIRTLYILHRHNAHRFTCHLIQLSYSCACQHTHASIPNGSGHNFHSVRYQSPSIQVAPTDSQFVFQTHTSIHQTGHRCKSNAADTRTTTLLKPNDLPAQSVPPFPPKKHTAQ
jgi:hypothetical protein